MKNIIIKITVFVLCIFLIAGIVLLYLADPSKIIKNTERQLTPYTVSRTLDNGNKKIEKDGKYGVIDANNKMIIPPRYDSVREVNGLFIVTVYKINKKNIDYFRSPKYALKYERIRNIKDKYKYGLYSGKGKVILPVKYDMIRNINDKYFYAKNNRGVILIDINGKRIFKENLYSDINEKALNKDSDKIWVKKKDKWGAVNFENKTVTDFIFNECPEEISNGVLMLPVYENSLNEEQKLDIKIKKQEEMIRRAQADNYPPVKLYKTEGDLHSVNVYNGEYKDKEDGMTHHSISDVVVNVDIINKPITLLLTSYEPVRWIIKPKQGAQIKKIYFSGYYDGEVITPSKNIPVEKTDKRLNFSKKDREKLIRYFDKSASSYQYQNSSASFIINGIIGADNNISIDKEVKFVVDENRYDNNISSGGLEVRYGNSGAYTFYKTNKYYNKGKYYFEVKNKCVKNSNWSNFGIISGFYEHCFGSECLGYKIKGNVDIKLNDIIGCAIDFDNGKMYISVNGKWIDSMPDKEKTLYRFKNDGSKYLVFAQVSEGDAFIFNFGANKFKYAPPKGYLPYDTYSANKIK